jgi:hypothetical protein
VQEVRDRVDEGLDEGERAADRGAPGHRVADGEGHAHVDESERDGLGHGFALLAGHGGMMEGGSRLFKQIVLISSI